MAATFVVLKKLFYLDELSLLIYPSSQDFAKLCFSPERSFQLQALPRLCCLSSSGVCLRTIES